MPLTPFQQRLLATLSGVEGSERYLAGGAALHRSDASARFSDDLDFFHDSEQRVATAFANDRRALEAAGYELELDFALPGFVRAIVRQGDGATRVDWAHDSAWRFFPLQRDTLGGYLLHPVDLAINKLLAVAGRDEPRDFVDILWAHEHILPLAGLAWAACGKDPGFSPLSLIELLRRRGHSRPEDFARLHLAQPFDLPSAKTRWSGALRDAEAFARARPPEELGCIYVDGATGLPGTPESGIGQRAFTPHFGAPGGVVPRIADSPLAPDDRSG
jgi:hypothetical protein